MISVHSQLFEFLVLSFIAARQEVPECAMPAAPMPTAPLQDFFRLLQCDPYHSFYIWFLSITNLPNFHAVMCCMVHAGSAARCHASRPYADCTFAAGLFFSLDWHSLMCITVFTYNLPNFHVVICWCMQEVPQGAMPAAPMPTAPLQQDFFRLLQCDPHHSFYIWFLSLTNLPNFHAVICWCMQEVPQGAMPAAPMPTAPVQQDALYIYSFHLISVHS